uniref:Arf-GAP domain-containing protein n=1 Tax=Canis lupus familiaris TaxID=9615 RepID=A0A8C0RPR5_CANLF
MVMAAKKGPGPGGGVSGGKAEAEAASEVWCRRVRELGGCSQAGNRHCFECAQRGVTYVDITVGSFVCTTCSGLLRGLNPPHRVKSISMTTFTEPEVVFLQSRGNEVCRKIWLGLFDARTSLIPDSRDPQKVKEFLQEKYEKKRWYVPPDQVKGPAYTKGSASTPIQGSIPEGKPLRTLLGDPVPSLSAAASASSQSICQSQPRTSQPWSSQPPPHSSIKKASTDLLADIGGDPFAAPQVAPAFAAFPAFGGQTPSHGGFANFDAFGSSPGSSAFGSIPPAGQGPFQAQPTATGSSQVTPFGASPLAPTSQPNSLPDMGSLLGPGVSAGGIPSSLHQPFHSTCYSPPAAFHQPVPAQWPGHRVQLWDEQYRAWLPPDSASHQGLCQHLPTASVPPTDLDDSAAEWLFLQRPRISQAGSEATEPASWDLYQPLHGKCQYGLGVGDGLSLGVGGRILEREWGNVGWKPCLRRATVSGLVSGSCCLPHSPAPHLPQLTNFPRILRLSSSGGEKNPGLQLFSPNPLIGDCCFFSDWILIKPVCLQTSNHQPILVALCPWGASSPPSGAPLLPGALVTICLWHFCGSETRMGLVLQGRGLGDGGGANALLGACR